MHRLDTASLVLTGVVGAAALALGGCAGERLPAFFGASPRGSVENVSPAQGLATGAEPIGGVADSCPDRPGVASTSNRTGSSPSRAGTSAGVTGATSGTTTPMGQRTSSPAPSTTVPTTVPTTVSTTLTTVLPTTVADPALPTLSVSAPLACRT